SDTPTCQDQGADGGQTACNQDCSLDTRGCTTCGDNQVMGAEQCEAGMLGGEMCRDGNPVHDFGAVECSATCTFSYLDCSDCGNGVKDGVEPCDGADVGGATCHAVNAVFDGGTLSCAACAIVT